MARLMLVQTGVIVKTHELDLASSHSEVTSQNQHQKQKLHLPSLPFFLFPLVMYHSIREP